MTMNAAPTSLAIKVVTGLVLGLMAGFCLAGIWQPGLLVVGALLAVVSWLCYLLAPTSYAIADGMLIVQSRLNRKQFGPVIRCSPVVRQDRFGIRLFGNGGLFAVSGIFWCRAYGVYRAYVTSIKPADLILVETATQKIVISPENPALFLASWQPAGVNRE